MADDDVLTEVSFDKILDYYGHGFYCPNCQYRNPCYIRKGVRIKDISIVCDKCGCSVKEKWRW